MGQYDKKVLSDESCLTVNVVHTASVEQHLTLFAKLALSMLSNAQKVEFSHPQGKKKQLKLWAELKLVVWRFLCPFMTHCHFACLLSLLMPNIILSFFLKVYKE